MSTAEILAIIYGRGTTAQLEEQDLKCMQYVAEHRYTLVFIAHDTPGERTAWDTAQQMVRDGKARVIVVASVSLMPHHLESVTGTLPPRAVERVREATRRTRLVPRPDGAG